LAKFVNMTSSTDLPAVILTCAGDWPNWKIYLISKLKKRKCFKAVKPFPSEPAPAETPSAPAEATTPTAPLTSDQEDMKELAIGILIPTIHQSLWCIFSADEEDPRVVIQALYDFFFTRTGANLVALTTTFNNLVARPGEHTKQFVARINTIATNLKALGGPLSDHQLIARLRAGLCKSDPQSWKGFFAVQDQRESQGTTLRYNEVCHSVQLYETSISADTEDNDQTFMANTPADKKPHCGRCGKDGHPAEKCWDTECVKPPPGYKKDKTPNRGPPTPCDCGEMHWRKDCPKRNKDSAFMAYTRKDFVLDSGSTKHISKNKDLILEYQPMGRNQLSVQGVSGHDIPVAGKGKLKNYPGVVYHIPSSPENILSISALEEHGWTATFANSVALLTAPNGHQIMGSRSHGDLYRVDDTCLIATADERHAADMLQWHQTFGHIQTVSRLQATAAKYGIDTSAWPKQLPDCTACIEGKLTRAHISRKPTNYADRTGNYKPGQRLHLDLMGPLENNDYALDAVDDATRYEMVEFISNKHKAAAATAKLIDSNYTKRQVDPDELHTDRGGEFTGQDWKDLCSERRIRSTLTPSGTPEHNGIAERTHGVAASMARAMLADAKLSPKKFGRQAYRHAVFLRNITTTRALPDGMTPFELWHGAPARIDNLLPFGADVFYHTNANSKFGKRAAPGLYMGPAMDTTGGAIRVHSLETGSEIITRSYKLNISGLCPPLKVKPTPFSDPDSDSEDEGFAADNPAAAPIPPPPAPAPTPAAPAATVPATPQQLSREIRELQTISAAGFGEPPASRTRRGPSRTDQGERTFIVASQDNPVQVLLASATMPTTYKGAMKLPDSKDWHAAFKKELLSLYEKGVFRIVPYQQGMRPINSRWVLKHKTDENNNPLDRKVRFVACGNTQIHGLDFFDVSAPVVSKEATRVAFAIAAQRGDHMLQFDFDQAYINADLDIKIYARLPDGFLDILRDYLTPEELQLVSSGKSYLQIIKALYGLKQAGLLWYKDLRAFLQSIGFKQSESDPCVFYNEATGVIAIIYVDDGILYARTKELADAVYQAIADRYSVKYIGKPRYFLGTTIEIRPDGSIFMHQRGYSELMGQTFAAGMPPKATPMIAGADLNPDSPPGDKPLYQEMVGTLNFASGNTRPDLAFAVSAESRNMQEPSKAHVTFARNTIAYAAATANYGLLFKPAPGIKLEVYCDASFAPDEHKRKSRSGWLILINGTPVAWSSTLQAIIAHSTAMAEYIALSESLRVAMYIKRLLQELGCDPGPITVYEDNMTTKIMAEEITTKRSKHIDIRYHHVRHLVDSGDINIVYCPTTDQLADALTKPLPKDTFCKLRDRFMAKGE
jgi:hypothetical protein